MNIALDIFGEDKFCAVSTQDFPEPGFTFPCFAPWKFLSGDNFDAARFASFLDQLVLSLQRLYEEDIDYMICIVPYDFMYPLRQMIVQTLQSYCAVENGARCMCSPECAALEQCREEPNSQDLYVRAERGLIEFGAYEQGCSYTEALGNTGIRIEAGAEQHVIGSRLKTELRQMVNDICLIGGCFDNIYVYGNAAEDVSPMLRQAKLIQKNGDDVPVTEIRDLALQGAMKEIMVLQHTDASALLLCAYPYNISMGLGDRGEHRVVVPRYHSYPLLRSARLLVSTETTLRVYEGNYSNPRFDTKITDIPLPDAKEGHEIECSASIDAGGSILLTVKDEEGKTLVEKFI